VDGKKVRDLKWLKAERLPARLSYSLGSVERTSVSSVIPAGEEA